MGLKEQVEKIPARVQPFIAEGWPDELYIREITEKDFADLRKYQRDNASDADDMPDHIFAYSAAMFLGDKDGARVFTDSDADLAILGGRGIAALQQIVAQGQEFNGLGDDAAKDMEKNSPETDGDDSPSV